MSEDTRNMLMATALALAFLVGWQFFIAPKLSSPQPAATQAAAPATPGAAATPALPGAAVPALSAPTREAALAGGKRVKIDTPALSGSINLVGGRIDDVTLKNYRETTDPKSPNIVLFSPVNAPQPYYADFGWLPDAGASAKPPGADALWAADGDALTPAKPLTLTYDAGGGLTFKRVISVDDRYMFTVEDSATNSGATAASLHPFGMIVRQGTPKVLGYAVLFEGMLADLGQSGLLEINYPGIEKETGATKSFSGDGGFLGFTDAYWAAALIPDQKAKVDARFAATGPVNLRTYAADFLGEAKTLASGQTVTVTTRLFAGAKKVDLIDGYAAKFNISHFDLMIDWGWFYFITKPLFKLLDFLNKFLGNFGLAVLALTVIVKAAFFPIANASYRSMAKMKAVQPEIEAIKTRFPDDRQAQQQAQMELFRKEKINPVAGCLPMLVQIPVFFALYKVIFTTIEMRQAPFFGWIHDLSAPDPLHIFNLFGLLPFDPSNIPLLGHYLGIGIWPVVMGCTQFIQMKMNPEPTDPTQKTMMTWMPVVMTFLLGGFPVGLVIYWTWNNTLSVLQQYYIMSKSGVKVELWDNLVKLLRKPAT